MAGEPFLEIAPLPVNCSAFASNADEARRIAFGSLRLVACQTCGYVRNADFDPEVVEYGTGYDNSLDHSEVYRAYEAELVGGLSRRWPSRNGTILEIGCGSGRFLAALCRQTGSQGVGFDPAWPGGTVDGRLSIVPAFFTGSEDITADHLVCCRHVLEHIADPHAFLLTVRQSMAPGCGLYIEVPNAQHIFGSSDVWDLIYPHCGYFSAPSLSTLVRRAGIEVLEVDDCYSGEFLSLHGASGEPRPGGDGHRARVEGVLAETRGFGQRFTQRVADAAGTLRGAAAAGRTVALWGAGARAVTFLNLVPGADRIPLIIDVNPAKAGRHVPGTGQQVVGPEQPEVSAADIVLVMNAVYAAEIGERLRLSGSEADIVLV